MSTAKRHASRLLRAFSESLQFASSPAGVTAQPVRSFSGGKFDPAAAVVQQGQFSQRFPHGYFMTPNAWNLPSAIDAGPPEIRLSQLVPVTDSEYQFWRDNGDEMFAMLIDAQSPNFGNWQRAALV